MKPDESRISWSAAGTSSARQPSLSDIRSFALDVSRDLDPGSRYIRELLAVIDASASVEDYLARLKDARNATYFRTDGRLISQGERGYSWLDDDAWQAMDVFECTLSNLITGETRMMWAGDGAGDFQRFGDAIADMGSTLSICSVPCSTGKEVYSLVIAALRVGLDVRAVGVDRQSAYVERARSGRLIPHHRDWDWPEAGDYFERIGGTTVAKPRVLERCSFAQGDVLTGELPTGPFDVVSCRNLLGYFRGDRLDAAWRNVAERARSGGLLLLDPFVTDSAEMADVPSGLRDEGFVRLFPDRSYYRAP